MTPPASRRFSRTVTGGLAFAVAVVALCGLVTVTAALVLALG